MRGARGVYSLKAALAAETISTYAQGIIPMNSILTNPDRRMRGIHYAGVVCIFASVLVLAPCLYSQADAPNNAPRVVQQPEPDLYSMKFDGRDVESLEQKLKSEFPSDNVVVAPSARYVRLAAFEVRNVRLQELGKTIEFLSEGRLTVDVTARVKGTSGNIWHIGSKRAAGPAVTAIVKMRSVAAPNLFGNEESVKRIITEANELENFRLRNIEETAIVRGGDFSGVVKTEIRPLMAQKVFVLVGNEEGIAGVESFIKATEQLAVEKAAEKRALTTSLAPKMRAVVAPHLFANEERLEKIGQEFNTVQEAWNDVHTKLMEMLGIDSRRGGVCVEPHPKQKLFVLYGSEEGLAGMESLIQAAEKNAADEDAQEMAIVMARAEEKAKKEAAEKADKGE